MPTTNDVRVNSDGSLSVTSAAFSTSGSNVASAASTSSSPTSTTSSSDPVINLNTTSTALPAVQAVNGVSLGTGASVFASTSGGTNVLLSFKSLVSGPGASVVDNGSSIAIGLDYTPRSVSLTGNADVGVTGHSDSANDFYQLKLLPTGVSAGTYTAASITVDPNGRIVSAASTDVGERNDGQNLGVNGAVFAGKSGTRLSFRTIGVTGGLTIQQTATDLILGTAGLGTVSAVNIQPGVGIAVSGGPVTTVGTMTVGLSNSGVAAGVYNNPQLTIDSTGRVLKAVSMPAPADVQCANIGDGDGYLYAQKVNGVLQFRGLKAGPAISISETGTLVTLDLVQTGVAGTYTFPVITLDNYGRVTAVTGGQQGAVPVATVTFTGSADITASATQTGSAIALSASLAPTGVVAGIYGSATTVPTLTVDANGRITGAASSPIPLGTTTTAGLLQVNATTSSTSTTQAAAPYAVKVAYDLAASKLDASAAAVSALKLASARAIALTGDLVGASSFDGSADISLSAVLANTGVVAGYYVNPALTVDAKGRITAITNGMAPGSPGSGTVTSVGIANSSSIVATGGPITASGSIKVDLTPTGVVPGTYTNATVSIDAQGRITSAANGTAPSGGTGTPGTASNVFSFRLNYGSDGSISAANVPSGWTVGVQGSQVTVTHNLGIGIVPTFVCSYGFGSAAFPNSLVQRIPAGSSTAAYSFASTNNQFVLYSATPTNTSSSNGNYTIVKITI